MVLIAALSPQYTDHNRPSLKRLRSASEEIVDTTPRKQQHLKAGIEAEWLFELHRCLWNQPQMEEKIFRTTDLTRAHWMKLQEALDARFPERHNDSYVAADDVSAIKLGVLSPTHVANDDGLTLANLNTSLPTATNATTPDRIGDQIPGEDFGEDDETHSEDVEIDHFLPTTIGYLDLSVLNLTSKPFRCAFPLLIRKEYETLEDILNKGLKGRLGSVFLTGQPGIGTRFGRPCRSSD
jgi:hypothetical protein